MWLEEYKKNRVKIGTYTSYEKYYQFCIHERMGEMFLTDIRGVDVQKFYNDLVKDGYALSSIKVASAVLNGCLRQAMRNGLIEQNPVRLAELPRQKEKKTRIAMTKEQQALFMEYAKESYLYNFFAVMLRTGLRRGEMPEYMRCYPWKIITCCMNPFYYPVYFSLYAFPANRLAIFITK